MMFIFKILNYFLFNLKMNLMILLKFNGLKLR